MVLETNGTVAPAQELETFLPQEKKKEIIGKPKTADIEASEYDPFADRKLGNPTSDMDTLTHLLKASLGTGILAMPKAFQSAGLVNGIFLTVVVAFICTHCSYILVKSAHILYKRTKRHTMTFAETAQVAFECGPEWAKKYAVFFRYLVLTSLFITYFGTCSVYTVIISENILQVAENIGVAESIDVRIIIAIFWIPLVLMGLIKNLKYLAPVSMIANILMGTGLIITMYYLAVGIKDVDVSERKLITHVTMWPTFISTTIFAMEAIGVVLPLENAMKTPKNMLGICGVLSKGMSAVTMIYIMLGFLGYLCYGDEGKDLITLDLDINEIPAKVVRIAIALAVYCSFGLQFFVCVEITWNAIKDKYAKNPNVAESAMRCILVTLCVLLAIAVPKISPFIGIIGAFCFSILGLMAPAAIEIITIWDNGFGKYNWIVWKNVFICIFAMIALIFGTKDAVVKIIETY